MLEEAGWHQPFPDVSPEAWESDDPTLGVALYPGGTHPRPALDFPDWADYLDPDDVVILSSIAF